MLEWPWDDAGWEEKGKSCRDERGELGECEGQRSLPEKFVRQGVGNKGVERAAHT